MSKWRIIAWRCFFAACTILVSSLVHGTGIAWAETLPSPSVLIVDSDLGDAELCKAHWLGEASTIVAQEGDRLLQGAQNPAWWSDDDAPATFLFSCEGAPITATDIVWALDKIRESGAEPHAFIVAMGTAGIPVREYVQDLSAIRQSARADVVGLAFLGTPHNGYSVGAAYPEAGLWASLSASIGHTSADLLPDSTYLQSLNAGVFPHVLKTLDVVGVVGDLGFGATDGAGIEADMTLMNSITSQVEQEKAEVTISRAMNLTGVWQPFTSSIDYPDRKLDQKLVEQLSAMECYETSPDALVQVREFYKMWFSRKPVVTHASYAVLLDLSGSMLEEADGTTSKLDAAKQAAKEYLHAMDACEALPLSAPMDVAVIGFSETTSTLASDHDDAAIEAIDEAMAAGETNIGIALEAALGALEAAPTCASKRILLLSDGANTRGQTEDQMLAGVVAKAKELGVVVDTIGFGDAGESNAAFLKRLSDETGGDSYSASDTYALRIDFLKSYYSSLGNDLIDVELDEGHEEDQSITADESTLALEFGLVSQGEAPGAVRLLCNGQEVDEALYTKSEQNGLSSLQCLNPPTGEYSLGNEGRLGQQHLFAVRQQGIASKQMATNMSEDHSLLIMLATGFALVLGIVLVVLFTRRRTSGSGSDEGTSS